MFIILDIILNLTCGSCNIIRFIEQYNLIENEYYLLIIDLVYQSKRGIKYKNEYYFYSSAFKLYIMHFKNTTVYF